MNVIDQLDREWAHLARSRTMRAALTGWRRAEPALDFPDLPALVAHVERRGVSPEHADRVLAALARLAPDDEWAARLLLQLLLPGCKALVRRYPFGDRDERAALVIGIAYDRIRTYPYERRPARIAANVLLDVRQRVLRHLAPVREVPWAEVPERVASVPAPADRWDILAWAVAQGHLDPAAARLVALTRIAGVPVADLAAAEGTKEQTLRRRRLRAEARLRRALTEAGLAGSGPAGAGREPGPGDRGPSRRPSPVAA